MASQIERFFHSIDYIEANILAPIEIKNAASMAAYSEYHYSRIFKALTGESPKNYIRKRRLSEAAQRLVATDDNIIDIALSCQFESQEAFTRSFKQYLLDTPAAYRQKQNNPAVRLKKPFSPDVLAHLTDNISLTPTLQQRSKTKVVGVVNHYQLEELDVLTLWSAFKPYRNSIPNRKGSSAFGLYRNYNENNEGIACTYCCCVEVENFDEVPEGMQSWELEAHWYAVFEHRVGVRELGETLRYIWGNWLPQSSYDYSPIVDFEVYAQAFDYHHPDANTTEIWIPIVPR